MVVEADTGVDIGLAAAVQVQRNEYIRFMGDAMNFTRSGVHLLLLIT
jgi:hypothetical protein